MKKIYFLAVVFFMMLLASGCKSSKPVVIETKTEVVKTVTETVHDTVFKIEKDSSSYKALIECINGKPKIKEVVSVKPGKNLKPPSVSIKGDYIQIDCEVRAHELFAQWKSKFVQEIQKTNTPVKVNELTFWQELQIKLFRFLLLLLLLFLGYNLIKYYLKK